SGLAGNLSIQSRVKFKGEVGLLDDVIGNGWTVISTAADPETVLGQEELEFFKQLKGKSVYISEDNSNNDEVFDYQGEYNRYFKQNECEAIIVRPDFYVYGVAKKLNELPQLLNNLASKMNLANDLILND